jgi:beta-glucanase (GH16 family)
MSRTREWVEAIRGPSLWRSPGRWRTGLRLKAGLSAAAVVVGTVAVTGFIALSGSGMANAAVAPPPAGFTLTWSDDFNGAAGTGLDTGTWKYDTGTGFGTGEIETMTNSTNNVFQDGNGHLVLRALHSGTDPRAGWTSGRIETQAATFGAPAGGVVRMESLIQQPNLTTANGAGYWPAFWMLGAPLRSGVGWPTSGEIDILEDINSRSSVFGTLHCGVGSGGPCHETTGIGSGERACPGCLTAYHDYAVEIDRSVSPEQIRWYLDGNNYFTTNSSVVDATTWANAVDHPFFIIYDLAMGGGFPDAFGGGPNAATVSGGQMNIDWVAVYNKGPGGGGDTTAPSTPTGLTASGTTSTSTNLSWNASTDNVGVTGYDVLRNGTSIATVTGTTYPAGGLTPSTAYSFAVRARDAAGNLSGNSTAVNVTTSGTGGGGGNIALNRPATSSANENATLGPANAVDGNLGTRWSSGFSDAQWIRVDLGQSYNITHVTLNWEAAFGRGYQIQTSPDGNAWTTIFSTTTGDGGTDDLAVTGTGRYIRMNGTQRATVYGYSLFEFAVNGTPSGGTGGSTLLSQGHPATSSSNENATLGPANAVDGNLGTRWSSGFSDAQWIQVDLGASHAINRVLLNWEAAFGRGYQIQTSPDGAAWTTIFSTTTGDGGTDDLTVSGNARFVRMNGTQRATVYGYSLFEFQVFGS